jgi:hypothetical protein
MGLYYIFSQEKSLLRGKKKKKNLKNQPDKPEVQMPLWQEVGIPLHRRRTQTSLLAPFCLS